MTFQLRKLGHVVLNVSDLEMSVRFYTEVLGMQISDRYPDGMVPGGMVFLRFDTDHHGVALVGGAPSLERSTLNHFAFEVGSPDEVFRARAWLRKHEVPIVFEGRRRAGCQLAIEFRDPDGNNLEIYWGIDQAARRDTCVRPPNGGPRARWRRPSPIPSSASARRCSGSHSALTRTSVIVPVTSSGRRIR